VRGIGVQMTPRKSPIRKRDGAPPADIRFGGACFTCGSPTREKMNRTTGELFYSCSRYPECDGRWRPHYHPPQYGPPCTGCGAQTIERQSTKDGSLFYGCVTYPKCDVGWRPPPSARCSACGWQKPVAPAFQAKALNAHRPACPKRKNGSESEDRR
jgi:ssDNA-binding Zn-finger/Zn-ribbon topoisomerase 1